MKLIIFILVFFSSVHLHAQFAAMNTNQPVDVTAGRSTYKWEIQKTILENTNNQKPVINQENSVLEADTIIYDQKLETGYAFGNVVYQNKKDKMVLTAGEGTYNTKKKEIIAKKNPVLIMKKDNTKAKSEVMKIYPNRDYVNMIGNVWITNQKFVIEGDNADMFQKSGKFKVMGNAVAKQEKTILNSDIIEADSKGGEIGSYAATGHVKVLDKKEGYTINSGRLDYYKELGYSKITKDPVITFTNKNVKAYSITMEKYDKEDKANLLGNVIIIQGNKKAYSKWGEYFSKDKKMILTGNPVLYQGKTKFAAQKIIVNIDSETMNMIGKGSGIYEFTNPTNK